jgi:hypothetical protein
MLLFIFLSHDGTGPDMDPADHIMARKERFDDDIIIKSYKREL